MSQWDVVVIGAGAAGLLAAARSAERGRRVLLLEKNRQAGVKILISGGTRCNITQSTDRRGIVRAFGEQGSFLHSALAKLGPEDVIALVEQEGVRTKVEDTGKVFPVSDRAIDVRDAIMRIVQRSSAVLRCDAPVRDLRAVSGGFELVTAHGVLQATNVIVTTGGKSYPGCGTTGDAYAWAESMGHTIVPTRPALVPIATRPAWVTELRGLTLPDTGVSIRHHAGVVETGKKKQSTGKRGSVLFTHFGLSGPAILDLSRQISGQSSFADTEVVCDFMPGESQDSLSSRLTEEWRSAGKKKALLVLTEFVPRRLAETLARLASLPEDRRAAEVSRRERQELIQLLKCCPIGVQGTLGYKKAEVTAGGVALDEVDSRTMESKCVPGLYFAGEVLDLDGPIGGYNFQAAFSTGWLAGECV